jgi:outer membrane receptor for ferrienterochelin and colicin
MKPSYRLVFCLLLFIGSSFSQLRAQKFTISGTVEDRSSGEKLINANLYDPVSLRGVITNNYGFYSITLPSGNLTLNCSYVGFKSQEIRLQLDHDTLINLRLEPSVALAEVTIQGKSVRSPVNNSQMSMTEISSKTIEKIPALLGEVDVLKALQLLPGVKSGTEGSSGIYVRGGGPDQNLILLDGVPVYNASHLFGFFSVFNTDAIQSVRLIQGGFPARYGGRLSSVLDIRMKEGNNQKFGIEGSVGLIASRLTVEGPIIKGKTSFLVSARRTYIDILAQPLIAFMASKESTSASTGGYYFQDFTAKINHTFSDRSRLYLSAYSGRDKAYVNVRDKAGDVVSKQNFGLGWGNLTTALRWNYILSPRLFSNTTLTYSRYNFITDMNSSETASDTLAGESLFSYNSGIRDIAAKIDFDWQPVTNHSVKFGYGHIFHEFQPGVTVFMMNQADAAAKIDTTFGNIRIKAQEMDLFIEDDWQIGTRFKINAGLHGAGFKVQDSTYISLQPRLSALFMINENWSLKAAYSQMSQHIHLLSNSTIGLPTDLWIPSTARVRPQKSVQYALGSVWSLKKGFELSIEGYYKTMDNLIEYKEGSSFFSLGGSWEDKLTFGRGVAYGAEFLLRKNEGKTTGWIGYTLAWSNRQFDDLNFGKWFPYRYDRRHDISIVLNHKFNDRIDIGGTWVYATGIAVTLPVMTYTRDVWPDPNRWPFYVHVYEGRNSYRMPAYHRLDLGINFHKEKKWGTRTWSFGAYNAYNRLNPFFMTEQILTAQGGFQFMQFKQYSLFPIIPYFSYNFRIK